MGELGGLVPTMAGYIALKIMVSRNFLVLETVILQKLTLCWTIEPWYKGTPYRGPKSPRKQTRVAVCVNK